jgi:flagellar basal body rod protein FlgC
MDKLIYTAASGLKGHMAAQAAIANNMANASTVARAPSPPPGATSMLPFRVTSGWRFRRMMVLKDIRAAAI